MAALGNLAAAHADGGALDRGAQTLTWDSIAVLLAPDGSPVLGSDDSNAYFAAFDWVAPATGTYRLQVTSFEAINTGTLVVTRR